MTSLNKICLHWTAGANTPCQVDLEAYHFCIDNLGRIYKGKYTPEDNIDCYDGKYAKHCEIPPVCRVSKANPTR